MTFSKGEPRNTTLLSENHTDNLRVHSLHNKKRRGREGSGKADMVAEEALNHQEPMFTFTDLEGGSKKKSPNKEQP